VSERKEGGKEGEMSSRALLYPAMAAADCESVEDSVDRSAVKISSLLPVSHFYLDALVWCDI
jgi:hypothetical protein